jgi:hypothetical protein
VSPNENTLGPAKGSTLGPQVQIWVRGTGFRRASLVLWYCSVRIQYAWSHSSLGFSQKIVENFTI